MISFPPPFAERKHQEELMDLPSTSRAEFMRALDEIRWVNRNLGGSAAVLEALLALVPPNFQGTLNILDLGTGSADIPIALVRWAREHGKNRGIDFRITALDLHPVAVEAARALTHDYPEILVMQGDALNLEEPERSYDFVISSLFMHHLTDRDAVRLLCEMARLCRRGLVVNDLERHPFAWLAISVLGLLTGKGRVFRNDAPLSVLRAFTRTELDNFCEQAGLPDMLIERRKPYRWVMSWQRSS